MTDTPPDRIDDSLALIVAEIRNLKAENERLRQDRDRLNWIDEHNASVSLIFDSPGGWHVKSRSGERYTRNGLRNAIDAARKGSAL